MRRLILALLLCAVPAFPAITVPAEAHGYTDDTGMTPLATSAGINVQAHDLIWVEVVQSWASCSGVSITVSDTASTNTFVQIGSQVANGYWGSACVSHFWVRDAAAKTGDIISVAFGSGQSYVTVNAVLIRGADNTLASLAAHDEKDGGNSTSITSNSLGSASTGDIVVAGIGLYANYPQTISAGACPNSATCTVAATTQTTLGMIEYRVLTGDQAGATMAASVPGPNTGICMVSARFKAASEAPPATGRRRVVIVN